MYNFTDVLIEDLIKLNDEDVLSEDIEKHNTLNPKLWNKDNTLKSEVKEKINDIVDTFLDGLKEDEVSFNLKDIIIVGSNASYNYNKDSDLDLHLIAENIEAPENLYEKLYSAYRSIFNKKLDIDFYGIPVEIFIEMNETNGIYNGVYSVMQDKWIQEPVEEDIPEIDQEAVDKEFKVWEDKYNKLIKSCESDLKEDIATVKLVSDVKSTEEVKNIIDSLPGDAIKIELYDADNGHNYGADYIKDLAKENKKLCGKLLYIITVFKQKGIETREPYTKPVSDDGIYEIRAKEGSNISRCLYFYVIGNTAIITNGFTKKTNKTPISEIEKAKKLRAEYYNSKRR